MIPTLERAAIIYNYMTKELGFKYYYWPNTGLYSVFADGYEHHLKDPKLLYRKYPDSFERILPDGFKYSLTKVDTYFHISYTDSISVCMRQIYDYEYSPSFCKLKDLKRMSLQYADEASPNDCYGLELIKSWISKKFLRYNVDYVDKDSCGKISFERTL